MAGSCVPVAHAVALRWMVLRDACDIQSADGGKPRLDPDQNRFGLRFPRPADRDRRSVQAVYRRCAGD
jgi:hypothetical protein